MPEEVECIEDTDVDDGEGQCWQSESVRIRNYLKDPYPNLHKRFGFESSA